MKPKDWLLWLQDWTGLDTPHIQWIAAAIASIVGAISFGLWIGRIWGWNAGRRALRHELRQFQKGDDEGKHCIIEVLIVKQKKGGGMLFDRETRGGVHLLSDVIGSDELADLVRESIHHGKNGHRVFPIGPLHRLLYERVDAYITGNEEGPSNNAVFERDDEYYEDEVGFTVRRMIGEDGFNMLHVLIGNPKYLRMIKDETFVKTLKPRRQKYGRRYFPIMPDLGTEFVESEEIFRTTEDEEKAGEKAVFWTTILRTQKAGIPLEQVNRMIDEALRRARQEVPAA